ncbi:RidA family protein [Longimicrobium sp.]|uniref:RidA family protein n=1 Tax=Longimicrobium sp. TaxID=2029185 RepID=UPI0032C21872
MSARQVGGRTEVSSGGPWEESVGYVRAVRTGPHIHVAGTTATGPDGEVVGVGDAYQQAWYTFMKIEQALRALGAEMRDVVRTRMFVTDISRWEDVGRAHGSFFAGGGPRPAATMVEVKALIHPDMLVEIEAEAYVVAQ